MRMTVMIVDDEAALLRAMQRLLGKSFDVVAAGTVKAALDGFGDHISAVLTDFSMPDGNGLQLTQGLRARGFTGPIAVLSAVAECDDLLRALATGEVNELISKPWKSSDLVDRVRSLCDKTAPVPLDPAGAERPAT